MRAIVLGSLAVLVGFLGDFLWSLVGDRVVGEVRRRKGQRVAVAAVLCSAVLVGAAIVWIASDASGPPASTPAQPVDQPVSGEDATTTQPSVILAPKDDPRLANCVTTGGTAESAEAPYGGVERSPGGVFVRARVANVTCGDNDYSEVVDAAFDHVVKVELWYGADESADGADLSVLLEPEPQAGSTVVVQGAALARGERVTSRTAVRLGRDDARLEFIPGSVVWRRNVAPPPTSPRFESESIREASIGRPQLLTRLRSGADGQGTVTALFRVIIPAISVRFETLDEGTDEWVQQCEVAPGELVTLRLQTKNLGNDDLLEVLARISLPPRGLEYVDDSATLALNSDPPEPVPDADLLGHGVDARTLRPGDTSVLQFRAVVGAGLEDSTELRSVGVAKWLGGNEYYNTVVLTIP